jgi:hypothetical protein
VTEGFCERLGGQLRKLWNIVFLQFSNVHHLPFPIPQKQPLRLSSGEAAPFPDLHIDTQKLKSFNFH